MLISVLTPHPRLEKYASASTTPQLQAPASPRLVMHSSTHLPTRTRIPASYSNSDVRGLDTQRARQSPSKPPARSSSMITSTSWIDGAPSQPRIFPGVVHERTRRGSVRQGSSSEKDVDAGGVLRPLPFEQDVKGLHGAVAEESGEGENGNIIRPRDGVSDDRDTR